MKTGTKEWSESSVNICKGCKNDCIYCWARDMALQYKQIKNGEEWANERINEKAVARGYSKRKGVIMFPTTHDITPGNVNECIAVLENLLVVGNKVLIVSKPNLLCIQSLCYELNIYSKQIEFRFSIGGKPSALGFWEPSAPSFGERLQCLDLVRNRGYKLSISCEPLLEPWGVEQMVTTFRLFDPDTIWVGTARKLVQRCAWKLPADHPEIVKLLKWQTPDKIMEVYELLKDNPIIRWKDSYKNVIGDLI